MKKIVLILLILVISGCKERISDKMPKDAFITIEPKVQVFDHKTISDIIRDTNVEIIDDNLNTDVIGEKDLDIYYTYQDKKYVYHTSYEVIDQEKPKIFGGNSKTLVIGYTGDLCNLVMYGDNYDSEPICTVKGDYNLEEVGKYSIEIEVRDASGNCTNHHLTLNMVEKISHNQGQTYDEKDLFADMYQKYKTDHTELGIDISEWQGEVDFEKVKSAGATFVMMRIGVKLKSGDEPKVDGEYLRNIKEAKKAGLKVGVYLYSKALSPEEAIEEANWVLDLLNGETLDLPIVFDWENWSNWNSYHLSFHELNLMPKAFIETVEDAGYEGMLYGSKFYLESFWEYSNAPVWLAHYAYSTSYEGNYFMWQFSNVGRIDGIYGDVDLNIMYQ